MDDRRYIWIAQSQHPLTHVNRVQIGVCSNYVVSHRNARTTGRTLIFGRRCIRKENETRHRNDADQAEYQAILHGRGSAVIDKATTPPEASTARQPHRTAPLPLALSS